MGGNLIARWQGARFIVHNDMKKREGGCTGSKVQKREADGLGGPTERKRGVLFSKCFFWGGGGRKGGKFTLTGSLFSGVGGKNMGGDWGPKRVERI